MTRARLLGCILTVLTLTIATPARAEWLVDMYLGATISPKSTFSIDMRDPLVGKVQTGDHISFDNSTGVGGRVGYWFESFRWLGTSVDVEHFRANVPHQVTTNMSHAGVFNSIQSLRVDVAAVTLDAMFRWPGLMPTPDVPQGSLQPYLTVGPSVFVTKLEDTGGNLNPTGQSATAPFPGFKLGTGLNWQFSKHMSIFTEYRYTQFTVSHDRTDFAGSSFAPLTPFQADMDVTLRTHHFLGGIGFRF